MVAHTSFPSSSGKHTVFQRGVERHELRLVRSGRDDDMAGSRGRYQSFSREAPPIRAGEPDVGAWYGQPSQDSLYILLVRSSEDTVEVQM